MPRAAVLTAAVTGAVLCAGPLVGTALAASPVLQSTVPTPASGSTITDPAKVPTVVSATYNDALYAPSSPVFPSHVTVTRNSASFPCTAGISSDMKTLTCTPASGTTFTDGVYDATFLASPAPTSGDTSPTTTHVLFTIDTTPPQLTSRTPAPDSQVQQPSSIVTTYAEKLQDPGSALTVTDSLSNVVGGASTVTTPTSTTGGVTWIPDGPLPDGLYTASVHATDLHGLTSSSTWQFAVDDTPPAPPVVVAPTFVNIANQHHVPITGTADNSNSTSGGASKIRVSATDGSNTVTLPDVSVGNDGSWSAASVADLSSLNDGALTITAEALDVAGNLSSASADQPSTKDAVAPTPAPTVNFPPGVTLNSSNPTLHVLGTTEEGVGVAVVAVDHLNNATSPITTTASNSDGSYDAVIDTTSLADGMLTITSTATDAAGNTSTGSNTISKDATPSGTPTISVFDPINDTNKSTPRPVSGKATPGDTVNVWLTDSTSNTPVSEQDGVPVNGSGDWSVSLDASGLADGPVTAHAVDVDPSSNQSAEATKVTIKDTGVPAAPAYVAPTWINNATKSAVVMSGTAEPGTTLHLVTTDSGAGTNTVDLPVLSDGTWSTTLDLHTFAEGTINFVATVVDQAGNQSSTTSHSSTKDTIAPGTPAAPTLTGPDQSAVITASGAATDGDSVLVTLTSDGGAGQATGTGPVSSSAYSVPVDASSLADGTVTAVATEIDPAGNSSATSPTATVVKDTTSPLVLVSSVPSDGSSVQTAPTLSATFNQQLDLAQSTVTLKDSVGATLGHSAPTLSADKKTISVSPTNSPLAEASGYQVIYTVKDLSDTDTLTPTVTFTVDRTAPAAPTVTSVADVFSGNAAAAPVSGNGGEPGSTVTAALTDGTHTANGAGPVADDGSWSVSIDARSLDDGPISASATQKDGAGNVSPVSASVPASNGKDTVAPAAPSLGWSNNVNHSTQTVTFSGVAEPGSTVTVSVDDANSGIAPVAGTTTAAGGGSWSKQLALSALADGPLAATAWATDAFGNVGPTANAAGSKDTVAPAVTLTAPRAPFSLGTVTARWRASDAVSGLAAAPYDVRWARGAHGKPLGGYRLLASGLKATSVSRTLSAGTTGCFEVRAHDAAGNVSGWTVARCSVVALDDSAMKASAGWTRAKDRRLYHGSAFTTTRHGATLTLPASAFDRAAIVATHCPTCGSIAIFAGSKRLKLIDLSSASTHRRVITAFGQFPFRTAKLTIKVVSRGKQVQIDGVGTSDR